MALDGAVNSRFIEILAEKYGERRTPFHIRNNAFDLSDKMFISIFRINKDMTQKIIDIFRERTVEPSRSSALNAEVKVLTTLRFLATGSYQMDIGDNIKFAISQPSVSRCITEVTNVLNHADIFRRWVHFPRNIDELRRNRDKFYEKHGMPCVIGCIGGTHVAIIAPPVDDEVYPENVYVNRKGYHSINVQLICDAHMRIINVNAKYPGSAHDSFIWENSNVLPVMRGLHNRGYTNFYLLGDSGYTFRPWLHVPVEDAQPGTQEDSYNECQRSTRATIERCNGVLKTRFRCLLKHRTLHFFPSRASKIINVCTILHNMCIEYQLPDPPPLDDEGVAQEDIDFGMYEDNPQANQIQQTQARVDPDLAAARRLRGRIIQNFF